MTAEIKITVDRQNVPAGMVLIDDVASLTKGLHDSVLRIIQNDLGYPCSTRLRDETKKLASMGLFDVNEGSGVLQFSPIPIDGMEGRHPSVIATSEIVRGIETYRDTGQWPAFLPSIIKKNLGEAVEPIMGGDSYVELRVTENGTLHVAELTIN